MEDSEGFEIFDLRFTIENVEVKRQRLALSGERRMKGGRGFEIFDYRFSIVIVFRISDVVLWRIRCGTPG